MWGKRTESERDGKRRRTIASEGVGEEAGRKNNGKRICLGAQATTPT